MRITQLHSTQDDIKYNDDIYCSNNIVWIRIRHGFWILIWRWWFFSWESFSRATIILMSWFYCCHRNNNIWCGARRSPVSPQFERQSVYYRWYLSCNKILIENFFPALDYYSVLERFLNTIVMHAYCNTKLPIKRQGNCKTLEETGQTNKHCNINDVMSKNV